MASDTSTLAAEAENMASGAAEAAAEASGGMPQLDFSTYPNQIFWLVITMVVIYLVLSRVALPRIASVLSVRHGAISSDLEQAEEFKRKAVEAEDAYTEALAQARAEANLIVTETKAEIAKNLEAATELADAEIAAKAAESEKAIREIRDNALQAVVAVATETAGEIVARLMPGASDDKAVKTAVNARLKG
jgi:F-type H+-transporting ATPase subunit b